MMNNYGNGNSSGNGNGNSSRSNSSYDFGSDYGPLSQLTESVNSLDPLNAMEKTINEQVSQLSKMHIH